MAPFEFSVTIPADRELAAMIRNVVAHGARQAGSPEAQALDFACRVEDAVRDLAGPGTADDSVTVVISLEDGPLQVAVTGRGDARTFALDV
jgi:hypothetical protein